MLLEYQRNSFHLFCFRLDSLPGLVAVDRIFDSPLELLSPAEKEMLTRISSDTRRQQWLACRAAAKLMIRQAFREKFDYSDITICSQNAEGRPVRPQLTVQGQTLPYVASFSHLNEAAVVALAASDSVFAVGTDLVRNQSVSPVVVKTFFSEREKNLLNGPQPITPDDIWAAKETTYKARCQGSGFSPRRIEVVSPLIGETVTTRMATDNQASHFDTQVVHLLKVADYRLGFCLIQDTRHAT
ncbi:MAG: 4'-phosphopantetheinyl transferase superfamily protein [Planctomycetia bacterium]|nr:4'-phosphopantetheinyl transferase superfamily protein [Planctomycetia bacterium]